MDEQVVPIIAGFRILRAKLIAQGGVQVNVNERKKSLQRLVIPHDTNSSNSDPNNKEAAFMFGGIEQIHFVPNHSHAPVVARSWTSVRWIYYLTGYFCCAAPLLFPGAQHDVYVGNRCCVGAEKLF